MENLTSETFERLDKLAVYLGTKSELLWEVLVRRGTAEGIAGLVTALSVALLAYGFWRLTRWGLVAAKSNRPDEEIPGVFAVVVGGLGLIVAPIVIIVTLRYAIIYLISPEFYAIDAYLYGAEVANAK